MGSRKAVKAQDDSIGAFFRNLFSPARAALNGGAICTNATDALH